VAGLAATSVPGLNPLQSEAVVFTHHSDLLAATARRGVLILCKARRWFSPRDPRPDTHHRGSLNPLQSEAVVFTKAERVLVASPHKGLNPLQSEAVVFTSVCKQVIAFARKVLILCKARRWFSPCLIPRDGCHPLVLILCKARQWFSQVVSGIQRRIGYDVLILCKARRWFSPKLEMPERLIVNRLNPLQSEAVVFARQSLILWGPAGGRRLNPLQSEAVVFTRW